MRFLEHDEADDPILSMVNLIDLFLVVIGILLIVIVQQEQAGEFVEAGFQTIHERFSIGRRLTTDCRTGCASSNTTRRTTRSSRWST